MNYKPLTVKGWIYAGFVAIVVVGSLLHGAYPFSGNSSFVGMFAPVNESVWEHLKLGYTALILFSIAEYFFIRKKVNNYAGAKLVGVIGLNATILIVFYTYTMFTHRSIVAVDILSYVLGCVCCQYVSFKMYHFKKLPAIINRLSILGIVAIGFVFALYTYNPPHLDLFKEKSSGKYGIMAEK